MSSSISSEESRCCDHGSISDVSQEETPPLPNANTPLDLAWILLMLMDYAMDYLLKEIIELCIFFILFTYYLFTEYLWMPIAFVVVPFGFILYYSLRPK